MQKIETLSETDGRDYVARPARLWGIIPAAGKGSRLQPLAFSKELLPIGVGGNQPEERPRAVSEFLIERLLLAGVTRLCVVIAPHKTDIISYYSSRLSKIDVCYTVQGAANGLCDAIFSALPFVGSDDDVLVGLPDTIWFPIDGLRGLSADTLSFLLFPVEHPELFDAAEIDAERHLRRFAVKQAAAPSQWVWRAFRASGGVLRQLHDLWLRRGSRDAYVGDLVNAYLAEGGAVELSFRGTSYVDVGTLGGYREAIKLVEGKPARAEFSPSPFR